MDAHALKSSARLDAVPVVGQLRQAGAGLPAADDPGIALDALDAVEHLLKRWCQRHHAGAPLSFAEPQLARRAVYVAHPLLQVPDKDGFYRRREASSGFPHHAFSRLDTVAQHLARTHAILGNFIPHLPISTVSEVWVQLAKNGTMSRKENRTAVSFPW